MIIFSVKKQTLFNKIITSLFKSKVILFLFGGLFIFIFLANSFLAWKFVQPKLPKIESKLKQLSHQVCVGAYYRFTTNPPAINLDIKFKDLQKIEQKRQQALARGVLLTSDDDYVPAVLNDGEKKIDVEVRLKGDWMDHLLTNKWSFRVKVKNEAAYRGMKYFSLQAPETRVFLNEWLAMQVFKEEGLIALRYDFLNLSINGDDKGIFAIEEHFSKELLENNNRREGPILKYSEDRIWENAVHYDLALGMEEGWVYRVQIEPFRTNKTINDPILSKQFLKAQSMLREYRDGNLPATQVFDLELWAKYFALADLFGFRHGLHTHNLKFYYNPIVGLFEPIAFDLMADQRITYLSIEDESFLTDYPQLLAELDFQKHYVFYLNKYSQAEYLDQLLNNYQAQITKLTRILRRDYAYQLNPSLFKANQNFVQKKLTDRPAIKVFLLDNQQLSITNLGQLPVEVLALKNKDGEEIVDLTKQKNIFLSVSRDLVPQSRNFNLPTLIDKSNLSEYQVEYQLLGLADKQTVNLAIWPIASLTAPAKANLPDFVQINKQEKIYFIPTGNWQLSSDLIVPAGFSLQVQAGTKLDLINHSKIISFSQVFFWGEAQQPIVVDSSDKTGEGILVLKTKASSKIFYTQFKNLSNIKDPGLGITGSVSFYEAEVELDNVIFKDNSCEDMLNAIRSKFKLSNVHFINSFADALDVDFGQGEISNCQFLNSGNDGIDVSGSVIKVVDTKIINARDKAISAGEKSSLLAENIVVENANLAFASKDLSDLTVKLSKIIGGNYGFAVYQKKPEYGSAILEIWNTANGAKHLYLLEKNSLVHNNGAIIPTEEKNVYEQLYPEDAK